MSRSTSRNMKKRRKDVEKKRVLDRFVSKAEMIQAIKNAAKPKLYGMATERD